MKKQANLGVFMNKINGIVGQTEEVGTSMHPSFEIIRKAIDEGVVSELSSETIKEVYEVFSKGVTTYQENVEQLKTLKAPVKLMGIQKKFESSYKKYTQACADMLDSVADGKVDVEAFNTSEKAQEVATDEISKCVSRFAMALMR